MLDPLALAPARFPTEAEYSVPDFSTLPEYCFPPTEVEKVAAMVSATTLPPPPAPPPDAPPPLEDLAGAADPVEAVACAAVEAELADEELVALVADTAETALLDLAKCTGFNTGALEV